MAVKPCERCGQGMLADTSTVCGYCGCRRFPAITGRITMRTWLGMVGGRIESAVGIRRIASSASLARARV